MLSVDDLKIGVKEWWSYKTLRNLRAGATSVRKKRVDRPEFHVGGTGGGVMGGWRANNHDSGLLLILISNKIKL
jgi:hypothetical protein